MSMTIERKPIAGLMVLGLPQYEYAVDGETCTFADALHRAELSNVVAVQDAAMAVSRSLRLRMRKLEDLGGVLAVLSRGQTYMANEKTDDTYSAAELSKVAEIAAGYDLDLGIRQAGSVWTITKGEISRAMTIVQQAINTENNSLAMTNQALDNFMTAKSTADQRVTSLVSRIMDGAKDIIRNVE